MAALLLAKLHQQPSNMQHAVEHAIGSLQGILLATVEAAGEAAHVKERTAEVNTWHLCCMSGDAVQPVTGHAIAAALPLVGSLWLLYMCQHKCVLYGLCLK